ncbi:MAG: GNAT family N-acetyltransferase [Anaerolineae bacterium]|nr:GNAT family N-acetyltransferase [Anaerolineae bacterium]
MPDILTNFSDADLTTAIESNLFEMFRVLYGYLPNPMYRDGPDATWFMSDLPLIEFNGVFHARLSPDSLDTQIREIVANFKAQNKPMVWWTGPSTQPENLGTHLQACGLLHVDDSPGMAIVLDDLKHKELPSNPSLTIKRVSSPDDMKQWGIPFGVSFDEPKKAVPLLCDSLSTFGFDEQEALHHYIGMLNGNVVGCSTVYLGAGVAGIYNVGTLPKARRQGIATALVFAALQMARDRGYQVGILHSTEMGHDVYRRIGFRTLCTISHYLYMPNPAMRAFLKLYFGAEHLLKNIRQSHRSK